jgi:hypothetical protein
MLPPRARQEHRSPKDRSGVASQELPDCEVAVNIAEEATLRRTTAMALKRRLAPMSKIDHTGTGTNLAIKAGLVVLCPFATASRNEQEPRENHTSGEIRDKIGRRCCRSRSAPAHVPLPNFLVARC